MATAQTIINQALRKINVIASGESPSTDESDDALVTLNQLIDSWSAMQVYLYAITKTDTTMTGAASYTLGTRLARVLSALVTQSNGASMPVEVVDSKGWAAIIDKSRTGLFAEALWYDAAASSAKVYLSPKPSAGTLELYSLTELTTLATLGTTVSFPKGYERLLVHALAIDLAAEFGREVPQSVIGVGQEAASGIRNLNAQVLGDAAPAPQQAAA